MTEQEWMERLRQGLEEGPETITSETDLDLMIRLRNMILLYDIKEALLRVVKELEK